MRFTPGDPAQDIANLVAAARDDTNPELMRLAVITTERFKREVRDRCVNHIQRLGMSLDGASFEPPEVLCEPDEVAVHLPVTGLPEKQARAASLIASHVLYVTAVELVGQQSDISRDCPR